MTEQKVLSYFCKKCGQRNDPYGNSKRNTPHTARVKCKKCGSLEEILWASPETTLKRVANKSGDNLSGELKSQLAIFTEKIKVLENGRDADRKEIQLLRQLIDLAIQKDIAKLKEKSSQHEYDKNFLQGQITKLEKTLEDIKNISLKNRKDLDDGR